MGRVKPSPTRPAVRPLLRLGDEAPPFVIRAGVWSDAPTGSSPELKLYPAVSAFGKLRGSRGLVLGYSFSMNVGQDLQPREAIREKSRATLNSSCLKPAKRIGEAAPAPAKRLRCFLNQSLSATTS